MHECICNMYCTIAHCIKFQVRPTARASFYSGQSRDLEVLPISGALFRPSLINNHYQPLWPPAMVQYFHFYAGTPPGKKSNIENALWIKKTCSDYLFQSHIDQENFLHGRLPLHSTFPPWRRPEGFSLIPDILYIGEGKERHIRRTRGGGNHPRKKPFLLDFAKNTGPKEIDTFEERCLGCYDY